jgi:hypothetical protein
MQSRKKHYRPHVNAKGRNDHHQYANLSYAFLLSAAFLSLSGGAVRVWLLMRTRFTGFNNGKITLSLEEAARILHVSKATVHAALAELVEKGLLVCMKKGQWYGRRASEWAVTDKGIGGAPPTNDWRQWRPRSEADENQNAVPDPNRRAA